MRRDENRAAPDDDPANGSRLGGCCAALAGMTAVTPIRCEFVMFLRAAAAPSEVTEVSQNFH